MIKRYKKLLIITSIVTVSPMLAGLLLWNRLPDQIATHFGSGNVANGWSSKSFAVFGLPFFLLAVHLICFFIIANDPKRKNIDGRFLKCFLWLVPLVSLVCCLPCYAIALGINVDIGMIVCLLLGVFFIVIGVLMRNIKQNYTVGVKLPWTLNSEENWDRTHRLTSKLWIAGGVIFGINSIPQFDSIMLAVIAILALVPIGYSFILYKKGI